MISLTPWLIILAEFGIAVVFALLERILWRDSWRVALVAGIVGGSIDFCLLRRCVSDYRSAN